jgi:hypothetical protein
MTAWTTVKVYRPLSLLRFYKEKIIVHNAASRIATLKCNVATLKGNVATLKCNVATMRTIQQTFTLFLQR